MEKKLIKEVKALVVGTQTRFPEKYEFCKIFNKTGKPVVAKVEENNDDVLNQKNLIVSIEENGVSKPCGIIFRRLKELLPVEHITSEEIYDLLHTYKDNSIEFNLVGVNSEFESLAYELVISIFE